MKDLTLAFANRRRQCHWRLEHGLDHAGVDEQKLHHLDGRYHRMKNELLVQHATHPRGVFQQPANG
jgi:hypothetical protein